MTLACKRANITAEHRRGPADKVDIMRKTTEQTTDALDQNGLLDRIEDAVLRVHPDIWLGGLVLAALAHFLGRLV